MQHNEPLQKAKRKYLWPIIIGFFLGIAFGAFAFTHDYPGAQLFFCWLIATWIAVCLHELGHAIACQIAGGTVQYIQLGWRTGDDQPWEVRFIGFNWHIYSLPFSGRAHGLFYTTENYRARQCFYIAGGPLVNLALLIPGVLLLDVVRFELWSPILIGWIAANVTLLVISVLPMTFLKQGSPFANDGMLFWQTLHYTDEDIQTSMKYAELFRLTGPESVIAEKMTLTELLAKHQAEPSNIVFLWTLVNKLHVMDDPRYQEFLLKLIALPQLKAEHIANLIDAYLTWQLHRGPPDQPEVADRLSKQLMEITDSVSVRGTRGSILVDLGRLDEGSTMLKEVLEKTMNTIDKTYANIFLALAEKQRGNLESAREHAKNAAKTDPACLALKRVSDLLSSAQETRETK